MFTTASENGRHPTTGAGKVQRIFGPEQEPSGTHRHAEKRESGVRQHLQEAREGVAREKEGEACFIQWSTHIKGTL